MLARQICYQRAGSAYSDLGEPRTAIEFCMKALDIMENDKENEWELLCFLTFVEAYDNLKDYEKAIHYYKKAGIKIEDFGNDPRETPELVVQCPYYILERSSFGKTRGRHTNQGRRIRTTKQINERS